MRFLLGDYFMRIKLISFLLIFSSFSVMAQRTIKTRLTPVVQTINRYLDTLLPDKEWQVLTSQIKDGADAYCVESSIDSSFERACSSHLDCLCKEHELGQLLKRYRDGDVFALDEVLGQVKGLKFSEKEQLARVVRKIDLVRAERQVFIDETAKVLPNQPRNYVFSIQPLSLIFGTVALAFEWKMEPWFSLRSGVSFLGSGFITDTYLGYINERDFSFFANTGAKFYVVGEAMSSGFYAEPRIDFGYENVINRASATRERIRDLAIVPAVMIGFDKIFPVGLQIDLGLGVGYYWAPYAFDTVSAAYQTRAVVPKFQASIGYAW